MLGRAVTRLKHVFKGSKWLQRGRQIRDGQQQKRETYRAYYSNQGDQEHCSQRMPQPPQREEQLDSEHIRNTELIISLPWVF